MRVTRDTTFSAESVRRLGELAHRARSADGQAPFSDELWQAAVEGLTDAALTTWAGVASDDAAPTPRAGRTPPAGHVPPAGQILSGAAFAARQGERRAAELLVDPDRRRHGLGGALLSELLDSVPGEVWVWSHGDHPGARALAARHGLDRARELFQLRRPADRPVPDTQAPPGVTVRTFQPGQDEEAWVAVNSAAFSWHPEQGSRTIDDIRAAQSEPWFDPDAFFVAESGGEMVGFHWTKIHPVVPDSPGDPALGEVYVLGVAPQAHGSGIGGHLTAVGLRHLAAQGAGEVMLYVEGDNAAALRVYERLGFTRYAVDVAYRRGAGE
ncbi:mycothiol synthase [Phytoactinopolyspora alkaliphila]|uniref:Mycothiol acetyltransferase n=1 Tax=Phytoactinopolyspora alkaliphila TaxID=1783498 RepID=A0A6N9YIY6_9ACTN|nr:mycothiol synthase [Phytoactinopolyspora alkaliphila]NED94963.1 mycothiol synthase [Phytoactinopolyspora alkaliphila]